MGYLFLMIALFAGAVKGYCGKMSSNYAENTQTALLISFIRMIICVIIGFVIVAVSGDLVTLRPTPKLMPITLLSAISTSLFVILWLIVVRRSAYMMIDVFLVLGTLVPMTASSLLFGEDITTVQWLGFTLLMIAVIIMCSYNNTIKKKMDVSTLFLLVLCGISSGLADFSQKLFVNESVNTPVSVFNFYTYLFSSVLLFLLLIAAKNRTGSAYYKHKCTSLIRVLPYVAVMAVCLFLNTLFKTKAAYHLDSVLLYPLNQGVSLTLSLGMSAVLFKEKPSAQCIAGVILSYLALLIINIL